MVYSRDGAHRLTQIQDSQANKIVYTLDAMRNRTAEQAYDPAGLRKPGSGLASCLTHTSM
jgi:hypothetical protein